MTVSDPATMVDAKPAVAECLLAWYDDHRRDLPWRAAPGEAADPYRVWLSEIMLQQTTVAAVTAYYRRFLGRWPGVTDLATAPLDDVLHTWQGLGYYARARNLHRCARQIVADHGGAFPEDEAALRRLPGIGAYTAAAIAAIAFQRAAVVVDGNVERVMARLHGVTDPLPKSKPRLRALAAAHTPAARPGDYAQAVMDLGATICLPRHAPRCAACPLAARCRGRADGVAATLPRRMPKPERPLRRGIAFWLTRADGAVLLRRRAERGLLGGMMEFPSSEWREGAWDLATAPGPALGPTIDSWRTLPGIVRHTFTHFHLELRVVTGRAADEAVPEGIWCPPDRLDGHALPTVMKKIARLGIATYSIL